VLGNEAVDGSLQVHDAAKAAPAQVCGRQLGEEAFHRVQPGG